jgi:hypothetical protein
MKFRIAVAKAVFNKKKTLFTSKLGLKLRFTLLKCYIWTIFFMVLKLGHCGE